VWHLLYTLYSKLYISGVQYRRIAITMQGLIEVIASLSTIQVTSAREPYARICRVWFFFYINVKIQLCFLQSAHYYWRYFWKHSDTIPYVICCCSVVFHLLKCSYANGLCLEWILLVFGRCAFAVLRSTCSWWVTTYVGKPSAVGQPTRPTQPFIVSGSINE